ncbi:MAG: hypothetical protein PUC30_09665 [Lachnospiraceae bacterium]|nr:hypothetical protein [Lachnospiraceae bacterium]
MRKTRYFFDMDGTLAVFQKIDTFERLLEPKYFLNLPPIRNLVYTVKAMARREDIEVFILSSYLTESATALKEKNMWLDKYIPEIDRTHRIFVPCGKRKSDYVPNPTEQDILIDDYHINLNAWHGVPVKVFNGINGTSNRGWKGESIHYLSNPEETIKFLTEELPTRLQKQINEAESPRM